MRTSIDTKYNGYLFRSRLEARWAVYFDNEGIEYEYETEGYVLPNGKKYLCDFWLPRVQMWAEVKAGAFTEQEELRCKLLAEVTGFPCLMLDGPPADTTYFAYGWYGMPGELKVCKNDYVVSRFHDGHDYYKYENRFYGSTSNEDGDRRIPFADEGDIPSPSVVAARSARFEYGETPVVRR